MEKDIETINYEGKEYVVLTRKTDNDKTIPCPFCKKRHTHGIGDGHRIVHCSTRDKIYTRPSDGKIFNQDDGYFIKTEQQ